MIAVDISNEKLDFSKVRCQKFWIVNYIEEIDIVTGTSDRFFKNRRSLWATVVVFR